MGSTRTISQRDPQPFLATTALEEFWDTSKPLVYLGEWCRRYNRRSFWQPLGGVVLNNPWDDSRRLYEAHHYVADLYERLLPALGEALNKIHDVKHGARYWRIILGPWLQFYIPSVYDRHTCLQFALDKYPGITSLTLSEESWIIPGNTYDFVQFILNDPYNLQIYSRILKLQGSAFPQKSFRVIATPAKDPGNKRVAIKRIMNKTIIAGFFAFAKTWKKGKSIILRNSYFSPKIELQLMIRTLGTVLPLPGGPGQTANVTVNSAARSMLQNIFPAANNFEIILDGLLARDVPQCFIEGFKEIERVSHRKYPKNPKAIFSSVAWYFDEEFKQWSATSAEQGTILLGMQHGGYYGGLRFFPSEDHELAISDRYYSWGWVPPSPTHKVMPSSAAKLSGRKPLGADNNKKGILFATTSWMPYLLQFYNPPHQFSEYLSWQPLFIKHLKPELISTIRLRPHRADLGWDMAQRWRDFCPQAAVESWDISFFQSLESCRLFVCDHQGTTFLEALAANKPSILFWNPEIAEPRPEAKPYYNQLRAIGILHDTPEAAADAVNAVYDDVETWWNDPTRQDARRIFCNRYARTSSHAVNEWVEEFQRISKEGLKTR